MALDLSAPTTNLLGLPSTGAENPFALPEKGVQVASIADPKVVYQGLIQRGLNPAQALASLGNFKQESELNTGAVNPGEGAYGLYQMRGDRRTSLDQMAKARGVTPDDLNLQLDHFVGEMKGSEAGNSRDFLAATDLASANAGLKKFIRYGDDSEGTRLANAEGYAKSLGVDANVGGGPKVQPMGLGVGSDATAGQRLFPESPAPAAAKTGLAALDPQMKKAMMLMMLQASMANVRLQPVDYDPFALMPHFG